MKKALIVTTVSGFVPQFEMSNIFILQNMGYEVHYASNFQNPHYGFDNHRLDGTGIICHQVDFVRSPFWIQKNAKAYWQLKEIMEKINFQMIHCHTPMGSVCGRLAAEKVRRRKWQHQKKRNAIVLYTVHGFHFYKGAPVINWIVYYAVERWLAHYTDFLITINQEDYTNAKKMHLRKNGKVYRIDGVGVPIDSYRNVMVDREKKRKELGILPKDYMLISVGELTKRKNHQVVIKALALLKKERLQRRICYVICGEGAERKHLTKLIRQNQMEDCVFLLGYRDDIKELLVISDCFVFPSKQEGLPVAVMEAMAAGVPCICSNIRGNRDLIEKNKGDILVKKNQEKDYCDAIKKMIRHQKEEETELDSEFKQSDKDRNRRKLQEKYAKWNIEKQMKGIYHDVEAIS